MSFLTLSDWKDLAITQEIRQELKRRQQDAKDYLAENAGKDPLQDRWYAGAIAAYQDFLDIELEESHDN